MTRTIRSLAWFALAAQALFVAAWVTAGALQPDYSHARSGVSELAAQGAAHPWIVMAGFTLLGLSAIALAPGLLAVLERRPAARAAAALFVVAGLGFIVAAFSRLDCDLSLDPCYDRFEDGALTWHTSVHLWAGLVVSLAIMGSAFALARALWPGPVAAIALIAGLAGIGLWLLGQVLYRTDGAPDGLAERVQLVAAQLWFVIAAVGILHETRGAPRFSAPVGLRPRDFFGSTWRGEGQVQLRPYWLTRHLAPRVEVTRSTDWRTDELGIVRDRAILPNGRVEERERYARFLDATHLHVSGDDMPGGADVVVDDAGYRISPYTVLVPVGPISLRVRCRDEARIEPDGALAHTVHARWLGLPVARMVMRVRAVDTAPEPGAAPAEALT